MEVRVLSTAPLFKSVVVNAPNALIGKAILGVLGPLNPAVLNALGEGQFQYGPAQVDVATFPEFLRVCEECEHRF